MFFSLQLGVRVVGGAGVVGVEKKKAMLPASVTACEPDDVTCHLQLMKVMMACMSAAYVHHLFDSTVLEPPPPALPKVPHEGSGGT